MEVNLFEALVNLWAGYADVTNLIVWQYCAYARFIQLTLVSVKQFQGYNINWPLSEFCNSISRYLAFQRFGNFSWFPPISDTATKFNLGKDGTGDDVTELWMFMMQSIYLLCIM